MAAEAHAPTASEYIVHHLQHLQNINQTKIVDFSVINYDSIIVGLVLGFLTLFVLWRAARTATSGVPGRFQAAVEILVEMVDNQAKANIPSAESRKFIAPLGLTVFVWIFMMNFMDMLPVDLLPTIWAQIYGAAGHDPHHAYLRVVPTADLSTTLGLAFAPLVARHLGHSRYVPLGYSRKYWYRDELSEPVSSITTPGKGKLLYVDPNQLSLIAGKRVLVVDDAVSSGTTMVSGLNLLARCGAEVAAIAVAMRQGTQWQQKLVRADGSPIPVVGAYDCPRMERRADGWWPESV